MGFPFFKPAYQSERKIHVYCHWPLVEDVPSLVAQMRYPYFPVSHNDLSSQIHSNYIDPGSNFSPYDGVTVRTLALNHPDNGCAFRIEAESRVFTFITDNELAPPGEAVTSYAAWVDFSRGSDLLVHDANYLDQEMPSKLGWGHSSVEQAVKLGRDAGVRRLSLFHHDTERTDSELDKIGDEANNLAKGDISVSVAREMETIVV
jgi:phosphoribosyl 1,2-cyclic phosphodiesterase